MPQFPMIPERERVLSKIPDYAVEILPAGCTITVSVGDQPIARSSAALLVKETRHADVYYLPRHDVDMSRLKRTEHQTYCPFKGHASYWSIGDEENVVWSYEDPYPEVDALRDYLSFYANRASISGEA